MGQPVVRVDAFAERPFEGNPAAVLLLEQPRDDAWLRAVAAELNAPATAYVELRPDGGRALRWFSPSAELALCGHGTLAAAHVLFEREPAAEALDFDTQSGRLTARRVAPAEKDPAVSAHADRPADAPATGPWIELDFPAVPAGPAEPPPGLLDGLGLAAARHVGRGHLDYLVEVNAAETVRALAPDFARLRAVETRGIIVTAPSEDPDFDFVSRFFAPRVGNDEDAVTGSAHCCLGPYWAERLGKAELVGRQLSARGGTVRVRPLGDRVRLAGRAVTVGRAELLV